MTEHLIIFRAQRDLSFKASGLKGNEGNRKSGKQTCWRKIKFLFRFLNWQNSQEYAYPTYYHEVFPMMQTLRTLGRFPFYLQKDSVGHLKLASLPVLYTAIFFLVQTSWTMAAVLELFTEKLTRHSDFDQFIFWTSILTFLGQNLIVPLTYWWDGPRFKDYVNHWLVVQENFKKHGLRVSGKLSKMLLWVSLLNFPFCFVFITLELNISGDLNFYFFLSFASVLVSSLSSLSLWCVTLKRIRIMSDLLLNKIVKANGTCNNYRRLEIITKSRKLWLELSEVTTGLGLAFSKTAISLAGSLFISFILSTYGCLSTVVINDTKTPSNIALVVVSSMTLIITFIIFDTADRTTEKVGCNFKSALLKMEMDTSPPFANALRQFILTINSNPPIIHFDGFVTINRNLFVSFISNTVTYLVVLLQFKTTSSGPIKFAQSVKKEL